MDAAKVSIHTIFASGYFCLDSSAAINEEAKVPLKPDENPIYRISLPDCNIGSKYSLKVLALTNAVVDLSPFFILS
jgi:hypothetical protein